MKSRLDKLAITDHSTSILALNNVTV